jgi:hypothetical protein
VAKPGKKPYGLRKILVCGYSAPEQSTLLYLLEENGFSDLPVVFVSNNDSGKALKELVGSPHKSGLGENSQMNRAVIMSGLSQKELYKLMAVYHLSELPSQFWASITPVSETWSVARLLSELAAETEASKKRVDDVNEYAHT